MYLSLLAAALVAGCAGSPNANVTQTDPKTGQPVQAAETAAAMLRAFPDIPIPANHKIDLDRSMIFTTPGQSMGKLATTGSGDVDSLYHFYIDKMPQNGWNLVNAFQSSTSSLYYAKPGRFVAIIIEPSGFKGSRVSLNIGPEGAASR
ncbi:MAG TPA: hypothetical protein VHP58_03705 [Alphaproteobacteria bacterium]|nr:hypothetical protein [Alphaproteobacteria bacterium]